MTRSTQRGTLQKEIEKLLGVYRIGGLPTVLSFDRSSQLVALHESTHLLDVNTTIHGYCLRRCNEISELNRWPWLRRLVPDLISRVLAESWFVFEGHATYLEYVSLRLFHDENAYRVWFDGLPQDYQEAFVLFSSLFLQNIDETLLAHGRGHPTHEFMYLQALSRGVASGILDHAFAAQFENIATWPELRKLFLQGRPDTFLKSNDWKLSVTVSKCLDHIGSLYGKAYFKVDASSTEMDNDCLLVSRCAKAYVWSAVAGGEFGHAADHNFQTDFLKKIDSDLLKRQPRLRQAKFYTHMSNTFVASDLRSLEIDRRVKVVTDNDVSTAIAAIQKAMSDVRFVKTILTLDQFGTGGYYILGVHNFITDDSTESFVFDEPIFYIKDIGIDDLIELSRAVNANPSSVKQFSEPVVFISTFGFNKEHNNIRSFAASLPSEISQFPLYIWLPVFDLNWIDEEDYKRRADNGLNYCVISSGTAQLEVAYLCADKYHAFWVGAGLFYLNGKAGDQILGGHTFRPYDLISNLNLAACVLTVTHSYSTATAMLIHQ